jgi:hypothetical protein
MSHFSNASAIASLDYFLTILIVMITVTFTLYLTMMFVVGAINRHSLHPISSLVPGEISSHPPLSSRYPQGVAFQDTIQPFKRPLTSLTIRQLKQRAKEAHIPKYSRMVKPQLVAALQAI